MYIYESGESKLSTNQDSMQSMLENESDFQKDNYDFLIKDAGLVPAEAAVVANGLDIFKSLHINGNLFQLKPNSQKTSSDSQLIEYYLLLSLRTGNLSFTLYLLEQTKTISDKSLVLEAIFSPSEYEQTKSKDKIVKLYKHISSHSKILSVGSSISHKKQIEKIMLEQAKRGHFTAIEAMIELKLIDDWNVVDTEGHTVLYYLMTRTIPPECSLSPQLLIKLGAKLSKNDKLGIENNTLIGQFEQAIKMYDNNSLESIRILIQNKLKQFSKEQIGKLALSALAANDLELIKKLLPLSDDGQLMLMLVNASTVESATILVDYLMDIDYTSYQEKSSTNAFAQRLGSDDYPSTYQQGNEFLLESLTEYLNQHQEQQSFKLIKRAMHRTVLLNHIKDIDVVRSLYHNAYIQGELLALTIGWTEHGVGLALLWDDKSDKTYVVLSNRGDAGLPACIVDEHTAELYKDNYGVVIYELPGKLDKAFFSGFELGEKKGGVFRYSLNSFKDDLRRLLGNAKLLTSVLCSNQNYGTCAYVNIKLTTAGILTVLELIKGKKMTESLRESIMKQYRSFSSQDKDNACSALISTYKLAEKVELGFRMNEYRKLIISLLLAHALDEKKENIKRMASLFQVLPKSDRKKLEKILPTPVVTNSLPDQSNLRSLSVFSNPKPKSNTPNHDKPFKITTDSVDNLMNRVQDIKILIDALNAQGFTNKEIIEIQLVKQSIVVITMPVQECKYKIRDYISFTLKIDVINRPGEFAFVISDLPKACKSIHEFKSHQAPLR